MLELLGAYGHGTRDKNTREAVDDNWGGKVVFITQDWVRKIIVCVVVFFPCVGEDTRQNNIF